MKILQQLAEAAKTDDNALSALLAIIMP